MPVTARVIAKGDNPKAAIIVYNRDTTTTIVDQISNQHCVVVELQTNIGTWILANQYYKFEDPIDIHLQKTKNIFLRYKGVLVVLRADANAKSGLWNSPTTDSKGEERELLIMELGLQVENIAGSHPTHENAAGGRTFIDVTLTNDKAHSMLKDWEVKTEQTQSDHNLIQFCMERKRSAGEEQRNTGKRPKFNIRKADWNKFRQELVIPPSEGHLDVNNYAKRLRNAIQHAMKAAIPTIKTDRKIHNVASTDAPSQLRAKVRAQRKVYQRSISMQERQLNLHRYRAIKEEYKEKVTQAKTTSWQHFVNRYMETDIWGMPYKIVSERIRAPTVFSTLRRRDGTQTEGWMQSADALLQELLPDDTAENEAPSPQRLRDRVADLPTNDVPVEDVTELEVQNILRELKPRKAPGPDNIPSEVLKQIQPQILLHLANLYNECLRQGRVPTIWKRADVVIIKKGEDRENLDPKTYRPISLMDNIGKIFENTLCSRLQNHRLNTYDMHPRQYAYRKGRSTEDALNDIQRTVENCTNKYLLGLFVDISGAFDNLWWPALFERLRQVGCPRQIFCCIRNYCQDRYATLHSSTNRTTKTLSKGCPQGSICGPFFWDITMDGLLWSLDELPELNTCSAYADDLLLTIAADSRHSLERQTATITEHLQMWCANNKLQLSQTKTTYMMLKGNLQRDPVVRLHGMPIKRSKTTKYLGVHIGEKLTFADHITQVCAKATCLMHKIARIAQGQYRIPLPSIRRYMTALMAKITTYGASFWAWKAKQVKQRQQINGAQRGILVRLTGAYRTTSSDALQVLTGVLPLDLKIQKSATEYWLRKRDFERIEAVLGHPAHSKIEIKEHILTVWQDRWNQSNKGRRVHALLPDVRQKMRMTHFNPTKGLIQFLSGHEPYAQ